MNLDTKELSQLIVSMVWYSSSDDVYYLLAKLAWAVSKQLDEEELQIVLEERLNKWVVSPNCYNDGN